MPTMNTWKDSWPLIEEVCPCDVQFNEWLAVRKLKSKTIFHFGTGEHHVVGVAQSSRNNRVLGITASKGEYDAYVALVSRNPAVARNYVAYFGDIYLTRRELLPELDVVTLFHLCEYFHPNTASQEYGGLTDRKLLDLLTDKVRKGGHILFYTRSSDFDKAKPIIAKWAKAKRVKRVDDFKLLQVYRKT